MCDRCDGKGFVTSTELVEHFGGAYRMPVYTVCTCLENDQCPACDGELVDISQIGNPETRLLCLNCQREWTI
jgi:hypothetical protein